MCDTEIRDSKGQRIVNLRLAKILKADGFDYPTEYYYQDEFLPYSDRGLKHMKNGKKMDHNKYESYIYSMPTYEQAFLFTTKQIKNNMSTQQFTFELIEGDYHAMHDSIYELFDYKPTQQDLEFYFNEIALSDRDLILDIIKYGAQDTEIREKLHIWLESNVEIEI